MTKQQTTIKARIFLPLLVLFYIIVFDERVAAQEQQAVLYREYLQQHLPSKAEIETFINGPSWAQFDSVCGYRLRNFMPHDGIDSSITISTIDSIGARKAYMYTDHKCRINSYGNSFTLCQQVNDGETWQEYLAAHLGEPVRNFGMGGYGAYQSYRRMIREEKTDHGAEYLLYYICCDDHIRSLFRCRYMLTHEWNNEMDEREGVGKMFHGNFWSNIEMDFTTGKLVEQKSLISSEKDLFKMTDGQWMYESLKDDLALQMALYISGQIRDIDFTKLEKLASILGSDVNFNKGDPRKKVKTLLDKYSFAATKYILDKARTFAKDNGKRLLVILCDPSVVISLITTSKRYDQEIVDYLKAEHFSYFDMNVVHQEDYKSFRLSLNDYLNRYWIGHYSPIGNHFFAFSIAPLVTNWLDPKPVTYDTIHKRMVGYKGYLNLHH